MKFNKLPLDTAFTIDLTPIEDERGFFARQFCANAFKSHGIESEIVQVNTSFSEKRGTLRGMHYQMAPKEETKLVRCIKGAIYDVILDLRPHSATYGKSYGTELTEDNRRMMFVPKGFAHGFLSLADKSEIIYLVSEYYSKEHERGVRWNDPNFNIAWPFAPSVISDKDNAYPDFNLIYT